MKFGVHREVTMTVSLIGCDAVLSGIDYRVIQEERSINLEKTFSVNLRIESHCDWE